MLPKSASAAGASRAAAKPLIIIAKPKAQTASRVAGAQGVSSNNGSGRNSDMVAEPSPKRQKQQQSGEVDVDKDCDDGSSDGGGRDGGCGGQPGQNKLSALLGGYGGSDDDDDDEEGGDGGARGG